MVRMAALAPAQSCLPPSICVLLGQFTTNVVACTGADHAGMSRRSSGVMGNPDLQLRTDSLGLTPLLAPLSPLPLFKVAPQPQHGLPSRTPPSPGGSGNGLPAMAIEVAAFDCSSSNDSVSTMTGRHDSKLIGKGQLSSQSLCNTDKLLTRHPRLLDRCLLLSVLPTGRHSRCTSLFCCTYSANVGACKGVVACHPDIVCNVLTLPDFLLSCRQCA